MSYLKGYSHLLHVENLRTYFFLEKGVLHAVDGVELWVDSGETLGIVGESGCGKSVTALSIIRLISPPGRIVDGKVLFNGIDLLSLKEKEIRKIRGREISMVFQEPLTSLNPVFTIGYQIGEVIKVHKGGSKKEIEERTVELLRMVGIPSPEKRLRSYPHELSGGMQQRVMIAMAIACHPALLIADEPTTALDVTIQAQILDLLISLKEKIGMSIIFITHDLGVVAGIAERVAVMYAGRIVELASTETLFSNPLHPYTIGLFECLPSIKKEKGELKSISGSIPDSINLPSGCKFHPRCLKSSKICAEKEPSLQEVYPGHWVRCHKSSPKKDFIKGITHVFKRWTSSQNY